MELGNQLFGNSRGEFSLPREELEGMFCEYLDQLGFDNYGYPQDKSMGSPFSNGIFTIRPYYWGDCTCGYDKKEAEWDASHNHSKDCYQTKYKALGVRYSSTDPDLEYKIQDLCEKFGLSYPDGSAMHCTCDYRSNWNKWTKNNDHLEACALVLPNFHYHPEDLRIKWYKYALRDAYSNKEVTKKQLRRILQTCVANLEERNDIRHP